MALQAGSARRPAWLAAGAAGALLAAAAPSAVLVAVLLAPAAGITLLDRGPGRSLSQVAWLYGAAFAAGPLWRLWSGVPDWGPALEIAGDPATVCLAWAGQGLGVALAEGLPLLLRAALEAQSRLQAARLRAARRGLEAEWGIAPRADAP